MKTALIVLATCSLVMFTGCAGNMNTSPVVPPVATPVQVAAVGWTWTGGTPYSSSGLGQPGVYGTLGTASSDSFPGSRGSSTGWVDDNGNFWIIGGYGLDVVGSSPGGLNDVWRYNLASSQWTWVGGSNLKGAVPVYGVRGIEAAPNIPGGRYFAAHWVDSIGNVWLFGGVGGDVAGATGQLNDLWMFSPQTNLWTWKQGSQTINALGVYGTKDVPSASNVPGARAQSVSWKDSAGNFWLFGGYGFDSTYQTIDLNDLWMFSPATQQWVWKGGGNLGGGKGIYGVQNIASSLSQPGSRELASSWVDATGNFWLFGGYGIDSAATRGYLNDMWEFTPSTMQWTWIGGSNVVSVFGNYGVQGAFTATNTPGARRDAVTWKDGNGFLWLFGGLGYGSSGSLGELNDLWKFDLTTKQWAWIAGSNQVNALGTYGTKGVAASTNLPGSRDGSVAATDTSGNVLLFGGYAANADGPLGVTLNDLWKYHP